MSRFLATRLDLTRLQSIKPDLILDLDYEAILKARLDSLQARLPDVDVLMLESEPLVKIQEEDAYRQLVDYGLLNDTTRGLLAAFATGTDLDHVALRAGVMRQVVGQDAFGKDILEDDETLRMRYFAGFGAPAAGSEDAYVYAALTAYPGAWDVRTVGPDEHDEPGQVDIVICAPGGVAVPPAALTAVAKAVNVKSVRPLTDAVGVFAAEIVPYQVEMTVEILRGPDPEAVRTDVLANLTRITEERYRGGGEVPIAALAAAGYDAGAVSVTVTKPVAGILRDPYKAPFCTAKTVTVTERVYG